LSPNSADPRYWQNMISIVECNPELAEAKKTLDRCGIAAEMR
jgi:hypothetical protein